MEGNRTFAFFFIVCILISVQNTYGQKTTKLDSIINGKLIISQHQFINNFLSQAINSVEKTPTAPDLRYLNTKSETPFLPFQGKTIRHITVIPLNFDQKLKDTSYHDNKGLQKLGKKLHTMTHEKVIRDNLFIKENTPLNAFKIADNERYLRTLENIHDSRIMVHKIKNNPDSVDLTVFTTDLFSIAGGIDADGLKRIKANAYETNFDGRGQHIDITEMYNISRSPNNGIGAFYRKDNVLHTFMSATAGFSSINGNGFTHEEETTEYINLSRQLVSAYSRFAGGLNISHNESSNLYHAPELNFYNYKYNLLDIWGGYNIGIRKLTANNNTIRDRRFLSIRYYNRNFSQLPFQIAKSAFNPVYNNSSALLAQITFFRQDYYRTQYVYGFGTTEDLPYGYNIGATIGWHKQLYLERPYAGINAQHYLASSHGDFLQLYLRTGGFLYQNKVQDGSFLIGVNVFSRLFFLNSTKIRQYIGLNYTQLNDMVTYAPLRINNEYGIRGFLSDSVSGTKRFTLQSETEFYLKFSLLGFHFAPFPYCDMSIIIPEHQSISKSSLFTGLGGGVRMRNENLVFETIELRAYFFPVAPDNMKGFKVILNSNIKYRYVSNFITAPDIVQLNSQ